MDDGHTQEAWSGACGMGAVMPVTALGRDCVMQGEIVYFRQLEVRTPVTATSGAPKHRGGGGVPELSLVFYGCTLKRAAGKKAHMKPSEAPQPWKIGRRYLRYLKKKRNLPTRLDAVTANYGSAVTDITGWGSGCRFNNN